MATGILMYHELERPGRPPADPDPGYVVYVVEEARFAAQVAWLAEAGVRGVSVGDAWRAGFDAPGQVGISFDDGCETDLTIAAPLLAARGFRATCYLVSRWIGRRAGFLSASQVRELAAAGFEIGSHSATHAFLSDLSDADLRRELVDSKHAIEDLVGAPVEHLSCPGGRWSRRVAERAREAGYATVATSRVGANAAGADAGALARCAVQRATPDRTFEAFCRGTGLAGPQLRDRVLATAKAMLGTRAYTALRGLALGGAPPAPSGRDGHAVEDSRRQL